MLAVSGLADRFPASRIFLVASVTGAAANAGFALLADMLTLGTALPYGLRAMFGTLPWQSVILASSLLALAGGVAIFLLGEGPYLKPVGKPRVGSRLGGGLRAFRFPRFRSAAFGYFGHMGELYALWALVPWLVADAAAADAIILSTSQVALLAFAVMGIGGFGCIGGGWLSIGRGSRFVATTALAVSGVICLLYPFLDGVGFAITVCSITLATSLYPMFGDQVAWLLAPGPALGLLGIAWGLRRG